MTNDRLGGNPDPNPTQVRKVRRHQSPEPYRVPLKLLFEWDGDGDEDLVEEHAFPEPTKMRYS
jgi:hypothetical protein